MRTTLLALLIAVSGLSGTIHAATPPLRHKVVHKHRKPRVAVVRPKRNVAAPKAKSGTLSAVPALPGTPALGPASLVHLERILPSQDPAPPPAPSEDADRSSAAPPAASALPSLAGMRKVLPQDDSPDELVAVPDSQAAPDAFPPADRDNLDLLWPVETRTISSPWGPRIRAKMIRVRTASRKRTRKVLRRFLGTHKGIDLSAPMGTDICAALDGEVVFSGKQKDYGNYVALDHGNGVVTLYAHCSRNFVQVGDIVRRGQKIAEVGRTGNATGPHLHFELRLDHIPQNPLPKMNDTEEIPADLLAQNEAAVPH